MNSIDPINEFDHTPDGIPAPFPIPETNDTPDEGGYFDDDEDYYALFWWNDDDDDDDYYYDDEDIGY